MLNQEGSHREEYPGLKTEELGLKPAALEKWHGFLFVTLEPGAPSVAFETRASGGRAGLPLWLQLGFGIVRRA